MIIEQVSKLLPEGIYLMDLKENPRGSSVRLIIDSEKAIDLKMTTKIAKMVQESGVLDTAFPRGCSLEVSSPGIMKPLTESFQFRKHIGRTLKLTIDRGYSTEHLQAKLLNADENGIQFSENKSDPESLSYTDIIEAKIKITFD